MLRAPPRMKHAKNVFFLCQQFLSDLQFLICMVYVHFFLLEKKKISWMGVLNQKISYNIMASPSISKHN